MSVSVCTSPCASVVKSTNSMKLFHELSIDIILDHKGRFAAEYQGIPAEGSGAERSGAVNEKSVDIHASSSQYLV